MPVYFVLFLIMEFLQRLFLYASLTAAICTVAGLFKPWVMLWWEDTQNRKKVLKIYGTAAVVTFALYWVTLLI